MPNERRRRIKHVVCVNIFGVYAQELTDITEFCIKYFRTFDWFITLTAAAVVAIVIGYNLPFCLRQHDCNTEWFGVWQLFEFQTILFIITSPKVLHVKSKLVDWNEWIWSGMCPPMLTLQVPQCFIFCGNACLQIHTPAIRQLLYTYT